MRSHQTRGVAISSIMSPSPGTGTHNYVKRIRALPTRSPFPSPQLAGQALNGPHTWPQTTHMVERGKSAAPPPPSALREGGRAPKNLEPQVGMTPRRTHNYTSNCSGNSSGSITRSEWACDRATEAVKIASIHPLSIIPDCGSRCKPKQIKYKSHLNSFCFFAAKW